MTSKETILAIIELKIKNLIKKCDGFVTRGEFSPVKNIVYGFVGLVLVAFAGALIALIIR